MDETKPKLNDSYWFDYSEKLVTNASEKRDQAAEKLQKMVLWLWGIYTTYAAVGFALSEKSLDIASVTIIVAASAALIAVYWSTVWVQMPITFTYDPRCPEDIQDTHSKIINEKSKRLNITLSLSVIAAGLVSVALFVASTGNNTIPDNTFLAEVSNNNGKTYLALTAYVTHSDKVIVKVDSTDSDFSNPELFVIKPTADGMIQTSLEIKQTKKDLMVQLEWEDDKKAKTTISKTVSIAKK